MSIDFATLRGLTIPEGAVDQIEDAFGRVLWRRFFGYVSFGDSIAAGHAINDSWKKDYGTGSQYGNNGNTSTALVPGCYTDLIRRELEAVHGADHVSVTSFAKSGDQTADLIEHLDRDVVRQAVAKADLVTICIGANDVLTPALEALPDYFVTGDLSALEVSIQNDLAALNNDAAPNSYMALLDKLYVINPRAKYVFSGIYSPYKYLWIDEGKDGFFAPLLNTIPQMTILGFEVDELIKDQLLDSPAIRRLMERVNGIHDYSNRYVSELNTLIRAKVNAKGANFIFADTKAVFDPVPDRPIAAPKHYNDLVNVEYTRGYDTAQMDWGAMWADSNAVSFWWDLTTKYVSTSGLDINGLAEELAGIVIEKVILPDVDPHPEAYGHYAMYCSFADALGWSQLPRRTITFHANGGVGKMSSQAVVALDNYTAYANIKANGFSHDTEGYRFVGWNTKADGSGTAYTNGQFIGLTGDLVLYAQWSNVYTITFSTTNSSVWGLDETDYEDYRKLTVGGGADVANASSITGIYGQMVYVEAKNKYDGDYSFIRVNGVNMVPESDSCSYSFPLTCDLHVAWDFDTYNTIFYDPEAFWRCNITTK